MTRYHVTGISDGEFTSTGLGGVATFAVGLLVGIICTHLYLGSLAERLSYSASSTSGFLAFCAVAGWVLVLVGCIMMLVGRGYRYNIIATELPDDEAD